MSDKDQYVFELQFKGKSDGSDFKENQYVIIDGSSMGDLSKLKADLGLCMPEPFAVQYIDDEEDIISIDTEEEFQEFAKIAKQRSSRGMYMRLILNSNLPLDHGQLPPHPDSKSYTLGGSSPRSESVKQRIKCGYNELKAKIKAELKDEILSELKEEFHTTAQAGDAAVANTEAENKEESGRKEEETKEPEYEEDSDGNLVLVYLPEKKKGKLLQHQKKKERHVETKIDQRLEKLELKRKKLMEKYSYHKTLARKPAVDLKMSLPSIISAIATKESSEMSKRVTVGKIFIHFWTIVNDGTLPLNSVELRHTWSSPGLEAEDPVVKVLPLLPGQESTLAVKFKAPRVPGSFISYWHFYRLVDSQWQQFGHYVSVTGCTKLPKAMLCDLAVKPPAKVTEPKKPEQKSVSFGDVVDIVDIPCSEGVPKEEKVLNEESNMTYKRQVEACQKQLEASLASSEIAAEMAREAAKAAFKRLAAAGASPKPSEADKLNDCHVDEVSASVQKLNLVDSESDTDFTVETSEETDPGFVIVDIPLHPNSEVEKPKEEEVNKLEANNLEVLEEGKADTHVNKIAEPLNEKDSVKKDTPPEVMFPRVEPNLNYPVFPPPPPRVTNSQFYLPTPLLPNPPYLFTPAPNASSPAIVFPPPPLINMSTPKMTPHMNYSQIPTYPPLIPPPPPVHVPISTQSTFASQHAPQMAPQNTINPHQIQFAPYTAPMRFCFEQTQSPGNYHGNGQTGWTPTENLTAGSTPNVQTTETAPNETLNIPNQEAKTSSASAPSAEGTDTQQQREVKPGTDGQNKTTDAGTPVQILPQALVDGAINVATTAYSTAWNALNNLRPKEGEASEFDPVFENNMAMLAEMGFNNYERNARLLKRFHNDINQVIGVICSTGGSHNLDID